MLRFERGVRIASSSSLIRNRGKNLELIPTWRSFMFSLSSEETLIYFIYPFRGLLYNFRYYLDVYITFLDGVHLHQIFGCSCIIPKAVVKTNTWDFDSSIILIIFEANLLFLVIIENLATGYSNSGGRLIAKLSRDLVSLVV